MKQIVTIALITLALAAQAPLRAAAPDEAVRQFKLAEGFELELVAAEPDIRQPVAINFDDRGRLWVVQYLQYPNPAGLKKIQVDQYMRTKFDRVPEPPPKGPRGADRITICEDTNGDGRADKFKDFVSGLNMATGVCVAYGGVFVAQSPYLLFYPDRNRDDVPDGDPEVCVEGFGMEDSHAYPNSLQIGPDGWLYGAQGSNVWAKVPVRTDKHGQTFAIRGQEPGARDQGKEKNARETPNAAPSPTSFLEFNQCVWRYHPPTRRFEVFAEGGGNTWGLDFDRHGQIIAGTNFGGVCGLHMVQGGYYVKGFAKHGPLSNPHAYGYFEHMPYASPAKISQGEHVMCGGIVYQGGAFGQEIENQYITCGLLHRKIYWHKLIPDRSTFKSDFGGTLVETNDPEFRPVDLALAPDGSVYIADWCDTRANHVIPEDTWNKTNGRIYRLSAKKVDREQEIRNDDALYYFDGGGLDVEIAWHAIGSAGRRNAFWRRSAIQRLGEWKDDLSLPVFDLLNSALQRPDQPLAVNALWALYRTGKLDERRALELLVHPNAEVRAWVVRLLGDERQVSRAIAARFLELARIDRSAVVRAQLASTARRLPCEVALPIIQALAACQDDKNDPQIPLLLWWAMEQNLPRHTDNVLALFEQSPRHPLVHWQAEYVARRLASEADGPSLIACAVLLEIADDDRLVLRGISQGLDGRRIDHPPHELNDSLAKRWDDPSRRPDLLPLRFQFGSNEAIAEALRLIGDPKQPANDRIAWIERIARLNRQDHVPALLKLLEQKENPAVQAAAINALARFKGEAAGDCLLVAASEMPENNRKLAFAALASRAVSASRLLSAVAAGKIPAREITADLVQAIQQHDDPALDALLEKHVGKFQAQSSTEKLEQMSRVNSLLAKSSGDATRGKPLFTKHCGTCHTLHGEGNKIGPDLTTADRSNRSLMVASVVDPNSGIRQEYAATALRTTDGQALVGIITANEPAAIALVDAKNITHKIAKGDIDEMKASPQSLMPEKILDPLSETEIRDLFAYIEAGVAHTIDRRRLIADFDRNPDDFALAENGSRTRPDHHPSGGAGGGWIAIKDAADSDAQLIAPAQFHGDLTPLIDGMAWFDARLVDADGKNDSEVHPAFGIFAISDGKQTIRQQLFHPKDPGPGNEWQRFSGRLTAEAFRTDAATFRAVLSNATDVRLTIESRANARETIGIDNFTLQAK